MSESEPPTPAATATADNAVEKGTPSTKTTGRRSSSTSTKKTSGTTTNPAAAADPLEAMSRPVGHGQHYGFAADIDCIRLFVDYEYRVIGGSGPTLGLSLFTYDDRGRYMERLHALSPNAQGPAPRRGPVWTKDRSAALTGEISVAQDYSDRMKGTSSHGARVNLAKIDPTVTALLVCLNGGPRSFSNVTTATLRVLSSPGDRGEGTFLAGAGGTVRTPLFHSSSRTRRDCNDVTVCIVYKDGWDHNGLPRWAAMPVFEPIFQTIARAKETFCAQLVVNLVPCLENCRPRLFPSVRALCAALSSDALPKLKAKFFSRGGRDGEGGSLNISEFIEGDTAAPSFSDHVSTTHLSPPPCPGHTLARALQRCFASSTSPTPRYWTSWRLATQVRRHTTNHSPARGPDRHAVMEYR